MQCCWSGSVWFLFSWIRIRYSEKRIRILCNQGKIIRKTLIPNFLWLLWLLSLKNDVDEPSKRKKQKNIRKKQFFLASWRSMTKIAGSGSVPKCLGSATLKRWIQCFLFFQILILVAVSALFLTVYALLFFSLEKWWVTTSSTFATLPPHPSPPRLQSIPCHKHTIFDFKFNW